MSIQTLTKQRIDYTSKDFEAWLIQLRAMALATFPMWTDHNRANIGNLQLELFAHTVDVLSHSIDNQTNERLVRTARQRKSMIDLGKNVSFVLPGATEASANLEFTIADGNTRAHDVIIPAGTRCRAPDIEGGITFWTTTEVEILTGSTQVSSVAARNAEPQQDNLTLDGTPNQKVLLSRTPYLEDSAVVVVGSDTYTVVDSLLTYDATDKVCVITVDENNAATILFGDGVNGYAPTGTGTADYETGGGEEGNVEANTIVQVLDPIYDDVGNTVVLVVRNPSAAGGGTDRMSVEEARIAIPESVLVSNLVTCTRDQFEINARLVRGVARSLVLCHDDDTSIPEYTANVHVVPTGGGLPSTALKNEVLTMLTVTRPQPIGMDVNILDPVLKIISVSAKVYLEQGYTEAQVRQNIEDSLDAFFALTDSDGVPNPLINFGYHVKNWQGGVAAEVPWSDIFNAVNDAEGVRKVEKSSFTPAIDQTLDNDEFPVLGSVSLVNGDTNLSF
jgi:hypothetical protein